MLNPNGIVPRHLILHLLNKDGESQHADIAQLLSGQAFTGSLDGREREIIVHYFRFYCEKERANVKFEN
jgi:hypothetical protein